MRGFLLLPSLAGLVACDSPRTLDEPDLEAAARRLASLDAEALLFALTAYGHLEQL